MSSGRATWRLVRGAVLGIAIVNCVWLSLLLLMPSLSAKSRATADATKLLQLLAPRSCDSRCASRLLGKSRAHSWVVRLTSPSWQRCFELDVTAFSYREDRGFSGLSGTNCP